MKHSLIWFLVFFLLSPCTLMAQPAQNPLTPQPGFMVKKIVVTGSTVLSVEELSRVTAPYVGRIEDLAVLERLAVAITLLYQQRGYLLAQAYVPPQTVENGIVEIDVIEGRVEKIDVKGNKYYSTSFIRWFLNSTLQKGLLNFTAFEKALMLLNEYPDLQVRSFLKPGFHPGTTEIIVQVKDGLPLHGQIDYNNYGNKFTGQNRFGAEVWEGDLTGRGDLFDVKEVFPFPSREHPFLQGTYSLPLDPSGKKLTLTYSNADIKVGSTLAVLDIRGAAQIYGMSVAQPLVRTLAVVSDASASFYYKNTENFAFGSLLTSKDKLREVVLSYDRRWTSKSARDLFDFSLTKGLGALFGGMPKDYPFISRFGADDNFFKINGDYAHIMKVLTPNDYLFLRGAAQLAFTELTSSEQYALGGSDTVRGYPQAFYLGDTGWNLSAELRHQLTPEKWNDVVQAAFFLDTGYVTLRNPLPGENGKSHLSGGGFGIRAGIGPNYNLSVDLGFPIDPRKIDNVVERPVLYLQMTSQF